MHRMKRIHMVSLFGAGLVIGIAGTAIAQKSGLVPLAAQQDPKLLADACTPQQTNDDVFFVSCGGIY
jgi:hypothetical protein